MKWILLHGLGQGPSAWDAVEASMQKVGSPLEQGEGNVPYPAKKAGNKETWSHRAEYETAGHTAAGCLEDRRLEVQCPDLKSLCAGSITYAHMYRGLVRQLDAEKEPVSLCGLSLGGVLALQYALEHPDKVRELVLVAPQFKMPKGLLRMQNGIFRLLPAGAFASMGMSRAEVITLTRSMMDLDFSAALHTLKKPVRVVCGQKDRTNQKAARQLVRALLDGSFYIVENAGHEVNADQPEKLALLLVEGSR